LGLSLSRALRSGADAGREEGDRRASLASALNQSAFNVGNALGPTRGAAALSFGFGCRLSPWIGAAFVLLCAATAVFSRVVESQEAVLLDTGDVTRLPD
jgi:predicted MFS family arabinose efflux permease